VVRIHYGEGTERGSSEMPDATSRRLEGTSCTGYASLDLFVFPTVRDVRVGGPPASSGRPRHGAGRSRVRLEHGVPGAGSPQRASWARRAARSALAWSWDTVSDASTTLLKTLLAASAGDRGRVSVRVHRSAAEEGACGYRSR
jgi:hypothetical protein